MCPLFRPLATPLAVFVPPTGNASSKQHSYCSASLDRNPQIARRCTFPAYSHCRGGAAAIRQCIVLYCLVLLSVALRCVVVCCMLLQCVASYCVAIYIYIYIYIYTHTYIHTYIHIYIYIYTASCQSVPCCSLFADARRPCGRRPPLVCRQRD